MNEFIHSAINEVNEKVVARDNQELWEAQQELIKQMESENVTRHTVIGVKRMRGDPVLKEVISFRLNHTDK
ncbi:hypothetical protein MKW94_010088 [Papaver nudicaule]|uniref:Uncharacterized protein n=1 Tax=Papaver nudicaule TaxID=74823 RepID=A0AA41VCG9_PAPNU|nr:hypothetical protein [Papaver nudicaule]